jgi:hypothetical protein
MKDYFLRGNFQDTVTTGFTTLSKSNLGNNAQRNYFRMKENDLAT